MSENESPETDQPEDEVFDGPVSEVDIIITVSGPSGSGLTTLAEKIAKGLNDKTGQFVFLENGQGLDGETEFVRPSQYEFPKKKSWDGVRRNITIRTEATE